MVWCYIFLTIMTTIFSPNSYFTHSLSHTHIFFLCRQPNKVGSWTAFFFLKSIECKWCYKEFFRPQTCTREYNSHLSCQLLQPIVITANSLLQLHCLIFLVALLCLGVSFFKCLNGSRRLQFSAWKGHSDKVWPAMGFVRGCLREIMTVKSISS